MEAENSNKSKLKTYASTSQNTFTLLSLQGFRIPDVISAKLVKVEIDKFTDVLQTGGMHYTLSL